MLYVFIEGSTDQAFIQEILQFPIESTKYIAYSNMTQTKVTRFISGIKCTQINDYIFLGDGDGHSISEKKEKLLEKYHSLTEDKVFVVCFEIESWYYAGVSQEYCNAKKFGKFEFCTDTLTKEDILNKLPIDKYPSISNIFLSIVVSATA